MTRFLIACLLVAGAARADSPPSLEKQVAGKIDEGIAALDPKPLKEAESLIAAAKEPHPLLLTRVYSALWTCYEAAAQAPKDAEAHALVGDLYGRSIALRSGMAWMTWGPKADAEIQKALKLDDKNAFAQAVGAPSPALRGEPRESHGIFRKGDLR